MTHEDFWSWGGGGGGGYERGGGGGGGGGDSANERGGDARRKFWNKPLKETHLGVAKAFYTDNIYIFSRATLNKTFTAKYDGALPRIP